MTTYRQPSQRSGKKAKSSEIGLYIGDFSCLDWVEDVVIQNLIQEFGLANCRELPDLKHVLVVHSNEDVSNAVYFERTQLRRCNMSS